MKRCADCLSTNLEDVSSVQCRDCGDEIDLDPDDDPSDFEGSVCQSCRDAGDSPWDFGDDESDRGGSLF